jgi:hypothetical protein
MSLKHFKIQGAGGRFITGMEAELELCPGILCFRARYGDAAAQASIYISLHPVS